MGMIGLSVAAPPVAQAAACSFPTPSPLPSADYRIETPADLQWLTSNRNEWTSGKTWTQTTDIDMGGCVWEGGGFRYNLSQNFAATYDGGGFSITGVNIELPSNQQNGGLFGLVTGTGTVKNLRYSGNVLPATGTTSQDRIGGMVGYLNGGTLENVGFSGNVQGEIYVGGLVGEGDRGGLILGSFSTGSVSLISGSSPANVGGLAGYGNDLAIIDSFSTSQVTGPSYRGGLVGAYINNFNELEDSYFAGAVIASGSNDTIGGVTGGTLIIGISNNFWRVDAPGTQATYGNGGSSPSDTGATPKTTAEMQSLSTFQSAGWDIAAGWTNPNGGTPVTWGICAPINDGFPFLNTFYSSDPCSNPPSPSAGDYSRPTATFHFRLPDGTECSTISPQLVYAYTTYILPGANAPCRTPGSELLGWSVSHHEWDFAPGATVDVIESQVFTAVLREPTVRITWSANVPQDDECLRRLDLSSSDASDREWTTYLHRSDLPADTRSGVFPALGDAVAPEQAPCAPPGFELAGWSIATEAGVVNVTPGSPIAAAINEASPSGAESRFMFRARWMPQTTSSTIVRAGFYESGSDEFTAKGLVDLETLVNAASETAESLNVEIVGVSESLASDQQNASLADRRARRLQELLQQAGVSGEFTTTTDHTIVPPALSRSGKPLSTVRIAITGT